MNYLKSVYQKALRMTFSSVSAGISDIKHNSYNHQISQRQLFLHYQNIKNQGLPLPMFRDTGFRVYSQNDEDGLLLYIFSLIGFTNKICVDMAFGSPFGANTTNLICNWGFYGLLIEGSGKPTTFFKSHKDTFIFPPKLQHVWIMRVIHFQLEGEYLETEC